MKRILMLYLSSYLIGGVGFALMPELTQKLMLSNVIYDEAMVKLAGLQYHALSTIIKLTIN